MPMVHDQLFESNRIHNVREKKVHCESLTKTIKKQISENKKFVPTNSGRKEYSNHISFENLKTHLTPFL